ncbi:hypothetical protein CL634_04390 [bacterium]|nr:hypothetical protein [bacterium]
MPTLRKKLKIAHVSPEVDPFAKTGGLAEVANALPRALHQLKHEVIVITPLHSRITSKKTHSLKKVFTDVEIELSEGLTKKFSCWQGELEPGLPVYFIDHGQYFGQSKQVYGTEHKNARWFFFDLAVIKLLELLEFQADVINCHDWPSALIPYFLRKRFQKNPFLSKMATQLTIHNLVFQSGINWWQIPKRYRLDPNSRLPHFKKSVAVERINFIKRGIVNTDIINTVSEQYAQEILTKNFGQDLHRILVNRKERVFGIVNGISYEAYNPATDPGLAARYDSKNMSGKAKNKKDLQRYFGLPTRADVPLLGMATRITEQKGIELLMKTLPRLLTSDIQFVIMGSGDKQYEQFFRKLTRQFPDKVGAHLEFDAKRATEVYAGSDMFLMPSRFEPCGLGQLISLRYGSIPIVRAIGGLADTVIDYNPRKGQGNGFVFKGYTPSYLLIAITRALETYHRPKEWEKLVTKGMSQSYSWEIPAKKYVALYRRAIKRRADEIKKKNGNGHKIKKNK